MTTILACMEKMPALFLGHGSPMNAIEDNEEKMEKFILDDIHQFLINYALQGRAFQLSIPAPEHFLPFMYILALKEKKDKISILNDKAVGGSLTMTSVQIGN